MKVSRAQTMVLSKATWIPETAVRVYTEAPGMIAVQVRSYGSTNEGRNGVSKHAYSHASLTQEQIEDLIKLLKSTLKASRNIRDEVQV